MTLSPPDASPASAFNAAALGVFCAENPTVSLPEEERLFLLVVAHCHTPSEPSALNPLLQEVSDIVFSSLATQGYWTYLRGRLLYSCFRKAFLEEVGAICARRRVDLCLRQSDFHQLISASPEGVAALLARTEERLVDSAIASGAAFHVREHFDFERHRWLREGANRLLPFALLLGALGFSLAAGVVIIERRDGMGLGVRLHHWISFLFELLF